jgi:hypothetical protein
MFRLLTFQHFVTLMNVLWKKRRKKNSLTNIFKLLQSSKFINCFRAVFNLITQTLLISHSKTQNTKLLAFKRFYYFNYNEPIIRTFQVNRTMIHNFSPKIFRLINKNFPNSPKMLQFCKQQVM